MPEITPQQVPPLFGEEFKNRFGSWLFNKFFASEDWGENMAYPGQLTPNYPDTMMSRVTGGWQPWDAGTMYLANMLGAPERGIPGMLGMGQQDPRLTQLQRWGGPQGPGTDAMSLMMQYGAPSQAGQYTANMAQFGISSEGAGRPLANMAYGVPTEAARYLLPFLEAPTYRAPTIPQRTVGRRA